MEKSSQTTEQLILEAAEREFLQKGFAGARTSAIAEAAGVNHAMLHYYFRTKENLFETIAAKKMVLLREILTITPEEAAMPLIEQIRTMTERHFEFVKANPDLPRFVITEIIGNPERREMILGHLRKYLPELINQFQLRIDEEVIRGNCRRVEASMLLFDIVSLNLFPFMMAPLSSAIFSDYDEFLELRKQEVIETIISRIRP